MKDILTYIGLALFVALSVKTLFSAIRDIYNSVKRKRMQEAEESIEWEDW